MSRCIIRFGGIIRAFRCDELEIVDLTDIVVAKGLDAVICDNDEITDVKFDMEDIERCSRMAEVCAGDDDSVTGKGPKSIEECVSSLDGYGDLHLGTVKLFLLVHSTSRYRDILGDELRKVLMEYLVLNFSISVKIADYLGIEEIVNYLLTHDLKLRETDRIYNHTLSCRQIVECMSYGYRLKFNGIIDRIHDVATFELALDFGMQVTEIHNGTYLTNELVAKCVNLKVLNLDSNPYVTELGECRDILEELHCCGSSGIRQECIDRCSMLKRLYIDDNPHISHCDYVGMKTLSIRGACGMSKYVLTGYPELRELHVDFDRDMSWLPGWVTKLCIYSCPNMEFRERTMSDYRQLKHLEIEDCRMIGVVGPNLKTFICLDEMRILSDHMPNYDSIMLRAVNLETLIVPHLKVIVAKMLKLKHLELQRVNQDEIVNPDVLEILKANCIGKSTLIPPRFSRNNTNDNSRGNNPEDDDDYYIDTDVGLHSFDAFTRLHTLHSPSIRVKLYEGSPIRELVCSDIIGSMSGLERLTINSPYTPLRNWSLKQIESVEYLRTSNCLLDVRHYPGLKEYEYNHDTEYSCVGDVRDLRILNCRKFTRSLNPHDIFDNSYENLKLLLKRVRMSAQLERPDIFSNIMTLRLSSSSYYELYCGCLPMLENLTVEGDIVLFGLEKMTNLISLEVDRMVNLEYRIEDNRPSIQGH